LIGGGTVGSPHVWFATLTSRLYRLTSEREWKMAESFHVLESDGVATITLCCPKTSNALTLDFWRAFPAAIRALDATGAIRAAILAAEGKNFCAGMDLSVFTSPALQDTGEPASRANFYHLARLMQAALTAIEQARFPVIAAIQGACVGAGLEMAAACDLRFCAADAYFKIAEIDIGMMADVGSLQRLPKLLPDAVVKQMAYTGMNLTATRAAAFGFANEVTADAEAALALARSAAAAIAARAPLAIAGSKDSLLFARDHSVAEALERAAWVQAAIWNTTEIKDAIAARVAKGTALFQDLPGLPEV
jgi:enoyl-CoA hydratase